MPMYVCESNPKLLKMCKSKQKKKRRKIKTKSLVWKDIKHVFGLLKEATLPFFMFWWGH